VVVWVCIFMEVEWVSGGSLSPCAQEGIVVAHTWRVRGVAVVVFERTCELRGDCSKYPALGCTLLISSLVLSQCL
jgi:hypothetical protein